MESGTLFVQRLDSPVGPLVGTWTENGLYAFGFEREDDVLDPAPGQVLADWTTNTLSQLKRWQQQLAEAVERYFRDGHFEWDCSTLDWTDVPPFQIEVLKQCYRIPAGKTMTYGALANAVGRPGAARAVGGTMAKNRWPLLIPCHRVVGASGKLTGYSGVGGIATKRWLLDHERGQSHAQLV